jgi:hypothetical protein
VLPPPFGVCLSALPIGVGVCVLLLSTGFGRPVGLTVVRVDCVTQGNLRR